MNIIVLLMASDPGLTQADMFYVMDSLWEILVHPQDTRSFRALYNGPSIDGADLRNFQEVMLVYLNSLPDPVGSLQQNCEVFCHEFQLVEMRHLMALVDSFPNEAIIMNARLHHYGTVVSPEALGDESRICPICIEGYGDGQEILELKSCRHHYHTKCFLDHMLRSGVNRNVCGLCRGLVEDPDRVNKDDVLIYGIDWAAEAVAELGRPAVAASDLDADSWPMISDVLSSPLV